MNYVYLGVAILAEVIATSALKASDHFTRFWPSVLVVLSYCLAFFSLSFALNTIPVGVAYAIWCGLGIVLVTIVSAFIYRQIPNVPVLVGMGLIIVGVIVVNVWSDSVGE